ncbi:hypothetical protein [Blautia sp. An81]|uniref:hypothetical protein n=1 Tax=Blautia sp. An81 TaxID=1965659 RepID=UPI000B36FFC0|nr:hypothetical protein [Blautia sp. An81]OUN31495.1 hypothetical protein B5G33_02000 [Blautia sp. An81]
MVKFVQMLFCDRNDSLRIVGQRRNIRLHRNAGLFTVRAVLSQNAAICTSFREPPSGELYTDKRETFRCFEIALKYACKITAFADRFRCGQNDHTYFTAQKREEFHGSGGGQNIHNHFYTSK